ncbi:glycosyltransferase [Salinibacter altiplanensis]|uniref:glycosyltransferase n=1 Tax=Salinibacter altiplanensis TaxID=1803181 RepID=UPI000C9EEB11|nr:glycosyltransferase [Salinibacter altiplanensis]
MTAPASLDVVHTVASTQAAHGGPSRSVPFLCEALAGQSVSVRLLTTVPGEEADAILPSAGVETRTVVEAGGLRQLLRSPVAFYRALRANIKEAPPDLIHDHGLWLPSNAAAAVVAWLEGIPLVISTRGMLTGWALAHNRWKKRLAWAAYQNHVLRQADLFHVTSQEEVDALRDLGFDQPAAIIPNGVPLLDLSSEDMSSRGTSSSGEHRALFLSRVHPKKGLPMLIEAWATADPDGWTLEIVGPSEDGHRGELEAQVRRHGLEGEIEFAGPVDDDEKWDVYRSADLFVLPTHSENFGIVVAEALAAEVPVLTTTGTPWSDLEAQGCGWWVSPSEESITEALQEAVGLGDETRRAMGKRGRRLVEAQYSWPGVVKNMTAAYRWLLGEGPRPEVIRQA